jgi:hypothetical protein
MHQFLRFDSNRQAYTYKAPSPDSCEVNLAFKLDETPAIRAGVRAMDRQVADSVFVGCLWRKRRMRG